jgi:dihydroorotate dehydrogenase
VLETWAYKNFVRPALFQLDAEDAHELGQRLLPASRGLMEVVSNYYLGSLDAALNLLETSVAGQALAHPIGLAAGFDKNAHLAAELAAIGFSFAEIGSVTARASRGNPRPRLFRLPRDGAVINRLGLNGEGATAVSARLAKVISAQQSRFPLALNIAPSNVPAGEIVMEEDIATTFASFKDLALTYVTINTSCPNTHEGVLKESSQLKNILERVSALNHQALPIFLKLSPDSSDDFVGRTLEVAREFGVKGFVLGNTSTTRNGLITAPDIVAAAGNGGLSGEPIRMRALNLVRRVAKLKSNHQEIIACGGISTADHVLDAIRAGACAVQLYTALIYEGPFHIIRLRRDLALALSRLGKPLRSLIGADLH